MDFNYPIVSKSSQPRPRLSDMHMLCIRPLRLKNWYTRQGTRYVDLSVWHVDINYIWLASSRSKNLRARFAKLNVSK